GTVGMQGSANLNDAKTAKSFRAAGERILRNEPSVPPPIGRLLGTRALGERRVDNDDDAWSLRLAALADLAQVDGLALSADRPARLARAHNLAMPGSLDGMLVEGIDEARRSRGVVQLPLRVALADDRRSEVAIVAPLLAVQGVEGHIVGLRVGRGFGVADGHVLVKVAELAALEVLRHGQQARDELATRQALSLFELARHVLLGEDIGETLQSVVELIGGSMGHDVAQIWLFRSGGSLALRASQPREGVALEIARPRDHTILARALGG